MAPGIVVALLMVALSVGFYASVRRYGYWKARTIGVGVMAVLLGGYLLVLAVGEIV